MTQEDKDLLLRDLCCRLPYGVICKSKSYRNILFNSSHISLIESEEIKPYLRPMSSMTKEEKEEYKKIAPGIVFTDGINLPHIPHDDWLNKKMFDYRGLIEKGLALEAPEGMYK